MSGIKDLKSLDETFLKYYLNRDKSHGIDHIQKVVVNVEKISQNYILSQREKYILRVSALLHDAYDHKYVIDNKEIIKIKENIHNDLINLGFTWNEIQIIFIIIDNISFSKEKENRYSELLSLLSIKIIHIRNIVSDADKIEALGLEGIYRMILYSTHKNKNITINELIYEIKKICTNKLYILISENYIRTDIGRKIALKKLEEMKEITDNEEKLKTFIQKFLNK